MIHELLAANSYSQVCKAEVLFTLVVVILLDTGHLHEFQAAIILKRQKVGMKIFFRVEIFFTRNGMKVLCIKIF